MDANLQKYLAFVKAVEYQSFTKAASVLNYSQSGVSRMISDLEKEWDVILLERNRTGLHLTSDGMELWPYAVNLCAEYEKLQIKVDDLHGLKSGIIRIGTFSSVATHWLPKMIKAFQTDYPQIEYELLLGDYTEIQKESSKSRYQIHDMGRLCHHVHGRSRTWHQHTAKPGPSKDSLPHRDKKAGDTGISENRTCYA